MKPKFDRGFFVTIDGPDGSGKTTVISELVKMFESFKIPVVSTREPGGVTISEEIREIILNPNHVMMSARTEALLYAASRSQNLIESVLPELEKGNLVLCDRFLDSSLVYQGYARGLGVEDVLAVNKFAIQDIEPDCTIFLMVPSKQGLDRIHKERHEKDINRLDLEDTYFHEQVHAGYELLIKMYPERISVIDSSKPILEVVTGVFNCIVNKLKLNINGDV